MDVCWEAIAPCIMGPDEKVPHSVNIVIGKVELTLFFG